MPRKANKAVFQDRYDHLRLDETIGFLLAETSRTMTRAFSRRISVHGVGLGIFHLLRVLWEEDGLTQREMAVRLRMKGPTIVAAVRELEWRGFIRRVYDPNDKRKAQLFLTAEGKKLYDLAMPDIEAIRRVMMVGFSDAEQETLKGMLRRMRDNLSPPRTEKAPVWNGEKERPARAGRVVRVT